MNTKSKTDDLPEAILQITNDKSPQTVQELVALVKENVSWSKKDVLDAVLKLHGEGKIKLVSSPLLVLSLSTYLKTSQALWYSATVVVAILTTVFAFLIKENFYPWIYFRNVFGVIFVLWLPGYTFLKAVFPSHVLIRESSGNLSNVERFALSVVMSMAFVIIIGLLLNYSPWGINSTMIILILFMFTLVFATVAVVREFNIKRKV